MSCQTNGPTRQHYFTKYASSGKMYLHDVDKKQNNISYIISIFICFQIMNNENQKELLQRYLKFIQICQLLSSTKLQPSTQNHFFLKNLTEQSSEPSDPAVFYETLACPFRCTDLWKSKNRDQTCQFRHRNPCFIIAVTVI